MSAFSEFRLNHATARKILLSPEVVEMVDKAAEKVAENARALTDKRVDVDHYRTDRGAAAVVIAGPDGRADQAVRGVFTRAAGSAGLEVRDRGGRG